MIGHDESTTTVQSLGRHPTCDFAVDDKDLVGGAFLIPGGPVGGGAEHNNDCRDSGDEPYHLGEISPLGAGCSC